MHQSRAQLLFRSTLSLFPCISLSLSLSLLNSEASYHLWTDSSLLTGFLSTLAKKRFLFSYSNFSQQLVYSFSFITGCQENIYIIYQFYYYLLQEKNKTSEQYNKHWICKTTKWYLQKNEKKIEVFVYWIIV